jgi:uncharacterized membrane protein YgaE (UPF0421/DUF939 family)
MPHLELAGLVRGRDVRGELRLAAKMTLAGTVAWWLSSTLGAERPIFAVLVPLVAMTGDPFAAVSVSIDRIAGIFAGVALGIGLVHAGLPGTVSVGIALGVGTAIGVLLRVGARLNVQAAISALFMLGVAGSSHAGIERVWETAIGAAVTVPTAALLWPPDPARELARRLERLRQSLASSLAQIAEDLATGNGAAASALVDLRESSLDAIRGFFEIEPAKRSLRLSPLRRGDARAVLDLERRLELAARMYRHARALARDVTDTRARSVDLAAATRDLADAADRALSGLDPQVPLERAEAALAGAGPPVVALQLAQLAADLRVRLA